MIVICEPFRRDFDHAQFDAALISSVAEAFPKEELMFCAEQDHIVHVQKAADGRLSAVRFVEIEVPARTSYNAQRGLASLVLCSRIFTCAHKKKARFIVFCSVHLYELLSIKILLRRFRRMRCLVVLHDVTIAVSALQSKPRTGLLNCGRWLLIGSTPKLRYLVLAPPIEERLKSDVPRLANNVSSIDIPLLFRDSASREPFMDDFIHFGFYGFASLRKGADAFFELAEETSAVETRYKPTFILIGQILDEQLKQARHTAVHVPSPETPLSPEEYEEYAKCIDYVLIFHSASAYKLDVSAAILDAFRFLKPLIALRSPLSEYYFNKMGDIGYLCETYADVENTILEILETKPASRYRIQQKNILAKRVQFSPSGVSTKLRAVLEQLERS